VFYATTKLDLSYNKLQGQVPHWLGELVNLDYLDLHDNPDLGGSLPSLTAYIITTYRTKISSVQVRVKPLGHGCKGIMDRLFIVGHVLAGYFDLVTDVLSIIEFGQQGSLYLMGLNIAFLLFNIGVAVGLEEGTWAESWDKKLSIIFQLSQITEAWEILTKGEQTPGFVQGKKVDAVCRSVPSVVLQLYGLLVTLNSLGTTGIFTITLSIVSGITGAAITLGTIAPKSGQGLFSLAFVIHFCYYVCELAVRLISI